MTFLNFRSGSAISCRAIALAAMSLTASETPARAFGKRLEDLDQAAVTTAALAEQLESATLFLPRPSTRVVWTAVDVGDVGNLRGLRRRRRVDQRRARAQ